MPKENTKRYNLIMSQFLFDELQAIADERHSTVLEVIKQFMRLGLFVFRVGKSSEAAVIIREGDREREIVLL